MELCRWIRIMDEHLWAVAGLEQIKHPISVASAMETTPHVPLVGNGTAVCIEHGFPKKESGNHLKVQKAYKEWLKFRI
jgi:isoaspartyl peptidase/L-asparaginase-like protein (Ntn-hydrolase superfamily)